MHLWNRRLHLASRKPWTTHLFVLIFTSASLYCKIKEVSFLCRRSLAKCTFLPHEAEMSALSLAWFSDGPRSLALTPSSPRLIFFVGSLVPDVIVCLNNRRMIRSQLYCLLEFELLKRKQWRRRRICFCAVSSERILACSRLSVVPLRRFLRITCHPKATRTYLSFKGMILRLRQEKCGKNLVVFLCYDLSANCNYTLTTFMY